MGHFMTVPYTHACNGCKHAAFYQSLTFPNRLPRTPTAYLLPPPFTPLIKVPHSLPSHPPPPHPTLHALPSPTPPTPLHPRLPAHPAPPLHFPSASLSERSKFVQETLVNVRGGGGVRRSRLRRSGSGLDTPDPDELIVVTLLVASRGPLPLPKRVDSGDSLRAALRALGALRAEQVMGVEVLWTPQAEGDSFSRDELCRDYPDMRSL